MANRTYNDRIPDGTSNPLKDEDLIGVSNEDGGGDYDLSKKILMSEVKAYIATALGSLSGTLNTIGMFTPDGKTIGDSPLTSDGTRLKLGSTLTVGDDSIDPTTKLYILNSNTTQYVAWFQNDYTGGISEGLLGRASGLNADNIGGNFQSLFGTNSNIGVLSSSEGEGASAIIANMKASGIDSSSFVGTTLHTTGGSSGRAIIYGEVLGGDTKDHVGAFYVIDNDTTGDSYGIKAFIAATGSGTAYIAHLQDGTEGLGKVLGDVTGDGKVQFIDPPSEFSDTLFRILDDIDNSKELAFDVSGLTTSTTRTITMPDRDVDLENIGGWLGSATRIKIAPWDIVSYNDKDGVSIQDDGGVVNDAAAKITTMVTGVFIPTGYRATAFKINASANIAVELFESQVWDSTSVSKGSGNANTEINITNVDSTTTNYLNIIIVEAGNDIYGGYITIEKI